MEVKNILAIMACLLLSSCGETAGQIRQRQWELRESATYEDRWQVMYCAKDLKHPLCTHPEIMEGNR